MMRLFTTATTGHCGLLFGSEIIIKMMKEKYESSYPRVKQKKSSKQPQYVNRDTHQRMSHALNGSNAE